MIDAWALFAAYLLGMGTALGLWWRPISVRRRQGAEIRRLRMALEDSTAKEAAQFAASERMARRLLDHPQVVRMDEDDERGGRR